mmetsp:Transcript_34624/g.98553  ORF Transcript_34624/g.98553 Transcript_34624/m.98553 type:complete len:614 (-) Transcript_34624:94-1935(-)
MSIELEHAIGCNVGFKNTCHLHPNGRDYVLAVGGVVIVGDLNNPHEQVFLHGHDDFITCLAVSHQGRLCATGQQGQNADVVVWNLDAKKQLFCFQEQDHGIDCLCFSFDDRYLYSCGDIVDQRVFIYDMASGLIIAWAQLHPKPTICVTSGGFVRDIKRRDTQEYQFAACGGKTISMMHLDALKGELTSQQIGNAGKQIREFTCLAFSSDFEYLFAGTTSGDIAVVLMKNRVVQQFVPVCSAGVTTLVVVPVGQGAARIVAGGGDSTVTVLSGMSPLEIREERQIHLDGPLVSLSRSGDAMEMLAVTCQGSSFRIRAKDLSFKVHSQVSAGALYDVSYVIGISDMFLTCCGDGLVTLWDANDYAARTRCAARTRSFPTAVTASEDIIVAGCNDGRLMAFDTQQGQNLWHVDNAHKGGVTTAMLSSNVRFVLTGGAEGELRIWELKTRDMASHLKEHSARVTEVQVFPNDQYAISCSRDRCLLTWDLRQQKRLTAHRERHGGINCLAVAGNQTTVYTAGQERTLTTWDLRMADPINVQQMDEEVQSVSLSPDGRFLATAGTGLVVKVWDMNIGKESSRGVGHSRAVQKVAFSPDGRQLVSVGLDHAALVWNLYA